MRRFVALSVLALLAPFATQSAANANGLGGYAVIHPDGHVCGVIVGNDYFSGNDRTMTSEYMGCPIGSRIIFQTKPSPTGNVAGWHGIDVTYSNGVFRLASGTTIQNGIATDPNGRVWDTGSGETITPAPSSGGSGSSGGGTSGGVVTPETSTSSIPPSETSTSSAPVPTPTATPTPSETSTPTPVQTPSASPTPQNQTQSAAVAKPVAEVVTDGSDEDAQGTLTVRRTDNGRYRLSVTTNLDSEDLVIRATKKGAKTIRFQVTLNEDGKAVIITSRNLAGYRLVLLFGEDSLDSVRAS